MIGPDKTGKFQALVDTHSGEKKVAYRSRRIAAKQGDKAVKSIGSTAEANAVFGITSPSEEIEASSPLEVVEATSPSQESEGSSSSLDTESLPSTQEEAPEPIVLSTPPREDSDVLIETETSVKVEQSATQEFGDFIEVPGSDSESEHSEIFDSGSENSVSENSSSENSSSEYSSDEYSEEEQEESESDFDSRFPLATPRNVSRALFTENETERATSFTPVEPPIFDDGERSESDTDDVQEPEQTVEATDANPAPSSSSSSSTTPVNAPASSRVPPFVQNAMKALMARPVPLAISFAVGSGLLLTGAALPVAVVAIATAYAGFEVARRVRETVAKRHYDDAVKKGWVNGETNQIVADRFPQLQTLDFIKGSQAETSWKKYAEHTLSPKTFLPSNAGYQIGRELKRRELEKEAANAPTVDSSAEHTPSCCKPKA